MRFWLAAMFLLGCSSESAAQTDAGAAKTCANTTCVAGASCTTPSGMVCRCYETGVWTCGDVAQSPGDDAGFVFPDAATEPVDTALPDSGLSRTIADCGATVPACTGDMPVAAAEERLRSQMVRCGASCTRLTLFAKGICAMRIEANVEWTATALDCVAAEVAAYTWTCASEFHASTEGSCPE